MFDTVLITDTDDEVRFYDGHGMTFSKIKEQACYSMLIALLKTGFLLAKTRLLLSYGTGFNAII